MSDPPVQDEIAQISSLLGLFLALVALFTAEQARRLERERLRVGGMEPRATRHVRLLALALAGVTGLASLALLPTVVKTFQDCCLGRPIYLVFDLTWLLLAGLVVWQVAIALRARSGV